MCNFSSLDYWREFTRLINYIATIIAESVAVRVSSLLLLRKGLYFVIMNNVQGFFPRNYCIVLCRIKIGVKFGEKCHLSKIFLLYIVIMVVAAVNDQSCIDSKMVHQLQLWRGGCKKKKWNYREPRARHLRLFTFTYTLVDWYLNGQATNQTTKY